MTESDWVERQLGRPVIKVVNSITAESLLNKDKPGEDAGRVALAPLSPMRPQRTAAGVIVGQGTAAYDSATCPESGARSIRLNIS
jgi:hypothetical protein